MTATSDSCSSKLPTSEPTGAYVEHRGTRREWVRFHVGRALAWPFLLVADVGDAADHTGMRILDWAERAFDSGEVSPDA